MEIVTPFLLVGIFPTTIPTTSLRTDIKPYARVSYGFISTRPRGARPGADWRSSAGRGFNPRARVGRDITISSFLDITNRFNPRARVGRDLLLLFCFEDHITFQSTRPRGARRKAAIEAAESVVSIHAPAWGATCQAGISSNAAQVSIHAPAWGATITICPDCGEFFVSIHAPAWGATASCLSKNRSKNVSIHAPAWGATRFGSFFAACQDVSIHAPAWGAPCGHGSRREGHPGFNPRARVGRDHRDGPAGT